MKRSRKIDNYLYSIYKDLYTDENKINTAIKNAKKAFSLLQKDAFYRKLSMMNYEKE